MKTLGVLSASVAAALSAAGATSCSSGPSGPIGCGGCGCGDAAPATQTVDVAFTLCDDAGAVDAGDLDAGDAGGDAAACFSSCAAACTAWSSGAICAGTSEDGGAMVAQCQVTEMCTGRRLEGLLEPELAGLSLGARLARMAWLEAASVRAFERLARELLHHGAPASLVRRAERAARDEARHARAMTRLAKKYGAKVPRVRVRTLERSESSDANGKARLARGATRVRELERLARENAVEGCVGETFGAAQAAWRARTAPDPELARALSAIAPDELRHAALGWAVAAWAEARLSGAARARVRAARDEAARELLQTTRASPAESAIARAMNDSLWAA